MSMGYMINSRNELREIINYEQMRWGAPSINTWIDRLKGELMLLLHPGNPRLYMYCLRKEEYYMARKNILYKYYRYQRRKLQGRTGIELPPNVAAPGVKVNHGKCVVSAAAEIGRDSVILSDVTIGGVGGARDLTGAAKIGNRVFIGSGARIIGPIRIADGVVIGANSVVISDIDTPNVTVAGIPAKIVSNKGSDEYIRLY